MNSFFEELDRFHDGISRRLPPKAASCAMADNLFNFIFPVLEEYTHPARIQYALLRHDLEALLRTVMPAKEQDLARVADGFFDQLPEVRTRLFEDAESILTFDPAATCIEEVVGTYPGFHAIGIYRIAHLLHRLDVPLLPRIFTEYVHGLTGIDIHPAARIGKYFFIDHGTGVVIGETAVVGENVKLYQGVTLGALQVNKSMANTKRHPTVEDHCIIYANSTILGGETVIGHHSVIGGNTWITESVSPYSIVLHQPQIKVRTKKDVDDPGDILNL